MDERMSNDDTIRGDKRGNKRRCLIMKALFLDYANISLLIFFLKKNPDLHRVTPSELLSFFFQEEKKVIH